MHKLHAWVFLFAGPAGLEPAVRDLESRGLPINRWALVFSYNTLPKS